jgi:hypothetical protein
MLTRYLPRQTPLTRRLLTRRRLQIRVRVRNGSVGDAARSGVSSCRIATESRPADIKGNNMHIRKTSLSVGVFALFGIAAVCFVVKQNRGPSIDIDPLDEHYAQM